jgi:hypothetical protein
MVIYFIFNTTMTFFLIHIFHFLYMTNTISSSQKSIMSLFFSYNSSIFLYDFHWSLLQHGQSKLKILVLKWLYILSSFAIQKNYNIVSPNYPPNYAFTLNIIWRAKWILMEELAMALKSCQQGYTYFGLACFNWILYFSKLQSHETLKCAKFIKGFWKS